MKCYKSGDKFIMIHGHLMVVAPIEFRINQDYYQGTIVDGGIDWNDCGFRDARLQEYLHDGTRAFFFKNISDLLYLKLHFNIDVDPAYYVTAIDKVLKKDL